MLPNDQSPCSAQVLTELLRRAEITSKARYNRSRALTKHAAWSQWTLAILAVGQVVISILPIYFKINLSSKQLLEFGGVFFGVLVLAYSLLLGMANYHSRAQKMHDCGLEMGQLAKKLYLHSCGANSTNSQYLGSVDEYYKILGKYENHEKIDYLDALTDKSGENSILTSFYHWGLRYIGFSHYLISLTVMTYWIIFCCIN
jgi:hypothetical protein